MKKLILIIFVLMSFALSAQVTITDAGNSIDILHGVETVKSMDKDGLSTITDGTNLVDFWQGGVAIWRIYYSEVSSPSTSNISDLMDTLAVYIASAGYSTATGLILGTDTVTNWDVFVDTATAQDIWGIKTYRAKSIWTPKRTFVGEYYNVISIADGGASTTFGTTVPAKTYMFNTEVRRVADSIMTGDSRDVLFKGVYRNYATNDGSSQMQGIGISVRNESGGTFTTMKAAEFGVNTKSGATSTNVTGLETTVEHYSAGATTNLYGLKVDLRNEGTEATNQYGIVITNTDNSTANASDAAIYVTDAGTNTGWDYGIDLSGATIGTADFKLHNGALFNNSSVDLFTITEATVDVDGNFTAGTIASDGNVKGTDYASDGSVSDAELKYINTLGSNAQTQLDARCLESVFGTSIGSGLTLDGTTLKITAGVYYAGMYFNDNSVATVIETATTPIMVRNFTAGSLSGFTFDAGSTGGITVYADYSGTVAGTVLVTSASHGLLDDDNISIRGTTDYNGIFTITKVGDDTFYITDTWVNDNGASDWDEGSHLIAGASSTGKYGLVYNCSCTEGGGAGSNVLGRLCNNSTLCIKCPSYRKFATNDYGNLSGTAIIDITVGDKIYFTIQSSGTNTLTLKYGNFNIHRL